MPRPPPLRKAVRAPVLLFVARGRASFIGSSPRACQTNRSPHRRPATTLDGTVTEHISTYSPRQAEPRGERLRRIWQASIQPTLVAVPLAGLAAGFAAQLAGHSALASALWAAGIVPVLVALVAQIVASLSRGEMGLDIVAAISMSGALALGEMLAGAVVALMYAGGQYLESFAEGRARREMTALLSRVPRVAMRHAGDGLEEVAIDEIAPGDRILVRQGEVVPVDGTLATRIGVLDQSALTGESLPVQRRRGGTVLSGSTNVGSAFDLIATQPAAKSTYAGIVRLVEAAQRERAPMVRLADRYAIWFLAVTVALAAAAWLWSGDPVRALAVFVVATPCPLILAVPVAIVAGVSQAAKGGVLVKGGGALETLARVRTVVVDKTGTLTHGRAELVGTDTFGALSADEVLRLAASLDQASNHVIAEALVTAARDRGLPLVTPHGVSEEAGSGLEGHVNGQRVTVGGAGYVRRRVSNPEALPLAAEEAGAVSVAVAVNGVAVGLLKLEDGVRPEAATVIAALRQAGVERIVLASGDHAHIATAVGRGLGIDDIHADLTPEDKVRTVLAERGRGPVMMVGDGVNDAPALAVADIGVAMGARGAAASSETAGAVLMVDRLDRLVAAMAIARRSRRIAEQSVAVGIGLSLAAMVVAALGYLPPVQGALLQEVIDVAAILNALRALRPPHDAMPVPAQSLARST